MIYGFGDMDEYNELSKEINSISARELLENESNPKVEEDMSNVKVPSLKSDEFGSKKENEEFGDEEAIFRAAGNTPEKKEEPEAQLGSLGGGFSPDKKMGLHEAFDKHDASDEDPMDDAQKQAAIFDKVRGMFNTVLDRKFETPKTIKYDMDSSKPMNHVSDKPITKIPRGW